MVQNYVWIHKCVSIVYPFQMAKKESAIRIRVDEEREHVVHPHQDVARPTAQLTRHVRRREREDHAVREEKASE